MARTPKTAISIRLTDEEMKLLDRVAARYGGSKTKAIADSLALREAKRELTKEQLIAEIERRLR